jgi:NADH dehydrogenase
MKHAQNKIKESDCKLTDIICLPDSSLPCVVIIGGGFAELSLLEKVRHKGLQMVLFNRDVFHQVQPLFCQLVKSSLRLPNVRQRFSK